MCAPEAGGRQEERRREPVQEERDAREAVHRDDYEVLAARDGAPGPVRGLAMALASRTAPAPGYP